MSKDNEGNVPQTENISDVIKKYKEQKEVAPESTVKPTDVPKTSFNKENFESQMSKETDPDLMTSYEIVDLPSRGKFYQNGLSKVNIEYMTSRDEDLLTTPSLIDSGDVLTKLLKRKIKTPNIDPDDLLAGDRNALILFLRTSSYGADYTVRVPDPRTGKEFTTKVDLLKLRYKELAELPDEEGHFDVFLPMRKKNVKIRLITSGEDLKLFKQAEQIRETYNQEVNDYSTMKIKAHIVSIEGKNDRDYISKFVDAMPALDAFTIRKKILEVSPDVDMTYEFQSKDGYKFEAELAVGLDFFFPST